MVGVAVVGAGNWGRNLVRAFGSLPQVDLRYICDRSDSVRADMAARYPRAEVTDDPDAPLGDPAVGAVVVAVDAPGHFEMARRCIQAGKHAYVEKPLTLSAGQAEQLVALACRAGVKLMVGHLLEYHPAVAYMKEMIDAGRIGSPLYLYSQRVNLGIIRQAENAWWSLAPHDVSVACYLFGAGPVSVSASGQAYLQQGVEDVVFATLKFADGRMAHVHVSWLDPHKIRRTTLVGSEKMVVFDDMAAAEKIRVYDKGADVRHVASYAEAITLRTGDILIPRISSAEPLAIECRHFIECIEEDRTPRSDGEDGLRVVRVLEAGQESIARGGRLVAL